MNSLEEIGTAVVGQSALPSNVLNYIYDKKYLQIWVPKNYGGLGYKLTEGLPILFELAKTDASLGWLVTLCAGANFFSRNLKPEVAQKIFSTPKTCFGGSGMIGGTAEKTQNGYLINGHWKYVTGAPHLTHFTLNAEVFENGEKQLDASGNPLIRSFVVPSEDVHFIADWESMGMKATGTYSFDVINVLIPLEHSFIYTEFHTEDSINEVPFSFFADVTLLMNYLGIAKHFITEAKAIQPDVAVAKMDELISSSSIYIFEKSNQIEQMLVRKIEIPEQLNTTMHEFGKNLVTQLITELMAIYVKLGIKASQTHQPIQQIFSDFFTITQHARFR